MSRDDREFDTYLAARWPALVRTLVLLGHPSREAHEIAFDALVRVQPEWRRLHREEDVEVAVHRELLDARERHLRRAPESPDSASEAVADRGPSSSGTPEQLERLEQVTAALARMTPAEQEVLVLGQVAELSPEQVADVLGRTAPDAPVLADADVRLALEAIPVEPVLAGRVAEEARTRSRRVVTRSLAALLAITVVLAGAGWIWQRASELGDVQPADNPLPVAWYADGWLHLADVRVQVPPVVDLVTVPDGVVLADEVGEVVLAEPDGELTVLGGTVPGEGLVVEPDNGWVAWADPGAGTPELVVFDTRVGDEVGRRSLSFPDAETGQPVGDTGPIAIDDERVHYRTRTTDFAWQPLQGEAFSLAGQLVDLADGAQLRRVEQSSRLLVKAQPFDTGSLISGIDARLTPDGRYVLAILADDLVVYESATGEEIPRMHSPSDQGLSWTYAGDDTFLVTVLHKLQDKQYQDTLQMPDEGDYRVYECVPGRDDTCVEVLRVPRESPDPPVLAR